MRKGHRKRNVEERKQGYGEIEIKLGRQKDGEKERQSSKEIERQREE